MEESDWGSIIENPNRVKILEFFSETPEKEITTQDLSDKLKIPESTLSVNLNELEEIGVLESRKDGKFKYYIMNRKVVEEIRDSISLMREAYTKLISKKKG